MYNNHNEVWTFVAMGPNCHTEFFDNWVSNDAAMDHSKKREYCHTGLEAATRCGPMQLWMWSLS